MSYDIAIVGATGMVGDVALQVLAERNFPVGKLFLLASARSCGKTKTFKSKEYPITDVADFDFKQADISIFSAGSDVSKKYVPIAAKAGTIVVDNTSCFRYDDNIPLVVPEVNSDKLSDIKPGAIIANPNCSTIQIVVALKPIYDEVGINRVNIATYQSVSGAGKAAYDELERETRAELNGEEYTVNVFNQKIAFNCLPEIDIWLDNGYTKEEMKMVWEMRKILGDETLAVNPTAVRVPTKIGHSAALHIETKEPIPVATVKKLLTSAPGIKVIEPYPTTAVHANHRDEVFVGRIRKDISHPNGLNMWVVSDNLRKGAATNAVQICEKIVTNSMLPK